MELPLNMDRREKLIIKTQELPWVDSPNPQVKRIPLEREKEESGEVTSIVRYEAGSQFKAHSHPLGEEIFVLEGEFADENGRYPTGTYIRNPPGSSHAPFSEKGCVIFVKLNQFNPNDKERVVIETGQVQWRPGIGGLEVMPLHEHQGQSTALVKWPAGERFQPHSHYGGEEIFVINGTFKDEYGEYPKGSWIRSPHLSKHFPFVDEETLILVKVGHLL
jgi:anti-sigma factor ChrR (cupin superfamily)